MKIIEQELFSRAINASFNSDWLDLYNINDLGIQIGVTTTANTGQFSIQISNDKSIVDTVVFNPVIPALADVNTTITVAMTDVPFHWARVVFTAGVGTNGTAVCKIFGKEE